MLLPFFQSSLSASQAVPSSSQASASSSQTSASSSQDSPPSSQFPLSPQKRRADEIDEDQSDREISINKIFTVIKIF